MAILLFCKKVEIVHQLALEQKGPLLMIANHPNSFLDAILVGAYTKNPVHFLARGDVFKKSYHRFVLGLLNMVPIYRLSEGKENLYLNEYAFKRSNDILLRGGILLLFIEGISLNTNQIQPFKKGAARIATAYISDQPLKILPIGITYENFNIYGKTVKLEIGETVLANAVLPYTDEAKNFSYFNTYFHSKMEQLVGIATRIEPKKVSIILQCLAFIGRLLHGPLYKILRYYAKKQTAGTAFYDAVLFGLLFFSYPLYLLMIVWLLLVAKLGIWMIGLVIVFFIITARVFVLYKQ